MPNVNITHLPLVWKPHADESAAWGLGRLSAPAGLAQVAPRTARWLPEQRETVYQVSWGRAGIWHALRTDHDGGVHKELGQYPCLESAVAACDLDWQSTGKSRAEKHTAIAQAESDESGDRIAAANAITAFLAAQRASEPAPAGSLVITCGHCGARLTTPWPPSCPACSGPLTQDYQPPSA